MKPGYAQKGRPELHVVDAVEAHLVPRRETPMTEGSRERADLMQDLGVGGCLSAHAVELKATKTEKTNAVSSLRS